jgi:hypothetical protein
MTTHTIQHARSTYTEHEDRSRLRSGALAVPAGLLSQIPLGALHPHQEYANDSVAAFHEYSHSAGWVLVHLGQFLGLLLVTIGLAAIATTLAKKPGVAGFLGFVTGFTAVVSAAVFAVQMAVDGVALKAAIDAWQATNGAVERAAAYGVADSVRDLPRRQGPAATGGLRPDRGPRRMAGVRPPLPRRRLHGPAHPARADRPRTPTRQRKRGDRRPRTADGIVSNNAKQHATNYTTPRDAIVTSNGAATNAAAPTLAIRRSTDDFLI